MPGKSGKTSSASKKSGNTGKTKSAGGTTGTAAFAFADPQASPDNFTSFSKANLAADTALKANQVIEQIPPLRKSPPVMSLGDVLPAATLNAYADRLTFHCVGDTEESRLPRTNSS
jgi:hypothetical protein